METVVEDSQGIGWQPWGGPGGQANGGGIYQGSNTLTVLGCTFASNYVVGGTGGGWGGYYTVDRTRCLRRSAAEPAAMGLAQASAPSADWFMPRTIRLPTTRREAATEVREADGDSGVRGSSGNGGNGYAGALYVSNATVHCINNTFGWNTGYRRRYRYWDKWNCDVEEELHGLAEAWPWPTIFSLIAAPRTATGTLVDLGHNISSDSSCNFTGTGSRNNVDPRILPLADNGGPTWTCALSPGSPAIDAGGTTGAPATDQRGLPRGSIH